VENQRPKQESVADSRLAFDGRRPLLTKTYDAEKLTIKITHACLVFVLALLQIRPPVYVLVAHDKTNWWAVLLMMNETSVPAFCQITV
jgi:hypothetical protein